LEFPVEAVQVLVAIISTVIIRTGVSIVRAMIAVITAVTAVIGASIHSAVDAGDAERREGSPYSRLGSVKRHV
jgi:hypothetical protein